MTREVRVSVPEHALGSRIDTFGDAQTSPFEARLKASLSINPEHTPA